MVLIIGGTGLVGSHLILEIYKKNLELRVTYRCKENLKNLKSCLIKNFKINSNYINSIDWVYADVIDITSLNDALKGVNFVYHCAAKVSLANYDKNQLYKINIEGTANVVNLCIKHKIKKLCYISSIASIKPKKSIGIINEDHSWDDTKLYTFYAFSKYAAEKEVWRGSQEGLNVVIVNPGLILGGKFNNSSMKKMLKIARSNFIFYPTGNIAIIDINDVVKILLLLMNSNITNERFILVSDNIKQKKLLNMLKLSVEKKEAYLPLTRPILNFLLTIETIMNYLGIKKKFMSKALIETLCSKQNYDGSKVSRLLSFNYKKF